MYRRELLVTSGLALIGAHEMSLADETSIDTGLKGVPKTSVRELAEALRLEGFQWRHIGRQIAFSATVLSDGTTPRVRIIGMDEGRLDTAWLHFAEAGLSAGVGTSVKVEGLIVDQSYGVWRIWVRHCSIIES